MFQRTLISLFCTMLTAFAWGQGDPLVEALRKYQSGELGAARSLIDDAVKGDDHQSDPEAWLLRGFVYKDLFKGATNISEGDVLRDEALASLYTTMELDTTGAYKENATQAYEFLSRSFYNDAATALNALDDERAKAVFAKFTESTLRLNPQMDLRNREVEFMNALGTVYTKQFNKDRDRIDRFEEAVSSYKNVLDLDPENYGANYNLATLFFNRGVYNIQSISADDEIPSILQIQEASREHFQSALPYMLKAHDMDPTRRETLLGLEGIYYSLQDQENSDRFRELFEELPPKEDR